MQLLKNITFLNAVKMSFADTMRGGSKNCSNLHDGIMNGPPVVDDNADNAFWYNLVVLIKIYPPCQIVTD